MTDKIIKVCGVCGGDDVFTNASVEWDYDSQSWLIDVVDHESDYCRDCDDLVTIKDGEA